MALFLALAPLVWDGVPKATSAVGAPGISLVLGPAMALSVGVLLGWDLVSLMVPPSGTFMTLKAPSVNLVFVATLAGPSNTLMVPKISRTPTLALLVISALWTNVAFEPTPPTTGTNCITLPGTL